MFTLSLLHRGFTINVCSARPLVPRNSTLMTSAKNLEVKHMLRNLSIVAAIAATIAIPVSAFAAHVHAHSNVHVNKNVHVNRNVHVNKNVHVDRNVHVNKNVHVNNLVVGNRYHGGVYFGNVGRYWHGQWYGYGVGSCWSLTPDGYYVWIC